MLSSPAGSDTYQNVYVCVRVLQVTLLVNLLLQLTLS